MSGSPSESSATVVDVGAAPGAYLTYTRQHFYDVRIKVDKLHDYRRLYMGPWQPVSTLKIPF